MACNLVYSCQWHWSWVSVNNSVHSPNKAPKALSVIKPLPEACAIKSTTGAPELSF